MDTRPATVERLPDCRDTHPEIKDPNIVRLPDGGLVMFASIGQTRGQRWVVGRFAADHPCGPWREVPPVRFHGLAGPQLCAPAVTYDEREGEPPWTMYIQTACLEADGVIGLATSADGLDFHGRPEPVVTRRSLERGQPSLVGVYDAGVSRVRHRGRPLTCMLFTGCNRVGDGDLYLAVRDDARREAGWTPARRVLGQHEVHFHNRPGCEHYEWGLEGAELVQLGEDAYLMVGVCFLEKGRGEAGNRQRVFFAASRSPFGPFVPLGTPVPPARHGEGRGENGHPAAVVEGDSLHLVYQERAGEGWPWHLRHATFPLAGLRTLVAEASRGGDGVPERVIPKAAAGEGVGDRPLADVGGASRHGPPAREIDILRAC
jgi:hypothetical protein